MKVKVIKWIEEIKELPDYMFYKQEEIFGEYVSEYAVTEDGAVYMEANNITAIEDLEGKTIAEL